MSQFQASWSNCVVIRTNDRLLPIESVSGATPRTQTSALDLCPSRESLDPESLELIRNFFELLAKWKEGITHGNQDLGQDGNPGR
jgi:hypothetical protein